MVVRQLAFAGSLCLLSQAVPAEFDSSRSPLQPVHAGSEIVPGTEWGDNLPDLLGNPLTAKDPVVINVQQEEKRSTLNVLVTPDSSLKLRARYHEEQRGGGTLSNFDPKTVGAGNLRFDYASSTSGGNHVLYGEVDFSGIGAGAAANYTWNGNRGFHAGFRGTRGSFAYGTSFGARGGNHQWLAKRTNFHEDLGTLALSSGKKGAEAWASLKFGRLSLRGSASRIADYWSGTRSTPYGSETKLGFGLKSTVWNSPNTSISASYYRGARASVRPAQGDKKSVHSFQQLRSSLSINGEKTGTSLTSSVLWSDASQEPTHYSTGASSHYLSAWYRPLRALRFGSQLGFSRYDHPQPRSRSLRRVASLSLNYDPKPGDLKLSMQGLVASNRNPAWSQDTRKFYLRTSLEPKLRRWGLRNSRISLNLTYDRSLNYVYPSANYDNLSLWLVFRSGASSPRSLTLSESIDKNRYGSLN